MFTGWPPFQFDFTKAFVSNMIIKEKMAPPPKVALFSTFFLSEPFAKEMHIRSLMYCGSLPEGSHKTLNVSHFLNAQTYRPYEFFTPSPRGTRKEFGIKCVFVLTQTVITQHKYCSCNVCTHLLKGNMS